MPPTPEPGSRHRVAVYLNPTESTKSKDSPRPRALRYGPVPIACSRSALALSSIAFCGTIIKTASSRGALRPGVLVVTSTVPGPKALEDLMAGQYPRFVKH
jgi:hypothetical protein